MDAHTLKWSEASSSSSMGCVLQAPADLSELQYSLAFTTKILRCLRFAMRDVCNRCVTDEQDPVWIDLCTSAQNAQATHWLAPRSRRTIARHNSANELTSRTCSGLVSYYAMGRMHLARAIEIRLSCREIPIRYIAQARIEPQWSANYW